VFVIVSVSAAVVMLAETPLYEAHAKILIEKESSNVISFKEAFEQNEVADDYYHTQYRIMESRTLAKRALDSGNLWIEPAPPRPRIGWLAAVPTTLNTITDRVKGAMGLTQLADARDVPTATAAESARIDDFLRRLVVAPISSTRLVELKYRSTDPQFAAKAVNTLARAYIDQNLEVKFLASKEASDWLSARLTEQRGRVEAAEAAIQRYREQNAAVSLDDRQNIVVQKLTDLNAAVTRAKTERIQKESLYNQIAQAGTNFEALGSMPQILGDRFVQEQKAQIAELQQERVQRSGKLGPNHPDMVKLSLAIQTADARLQNEIGKVVESVKNDYLSAKTQEQSLSRALEAQKQEALALNATAIEYSALQRDAASTQQVFDALMQRTKETGISGELKTSNIRIVDPAEVPQTPATLGVRSGLTRAALYGLFGAIIICFLIDSLDNRINTPDDLAEHLDLRYLGMVPAVFEKRPKNPLITTSVQPAFVEAFRTLGTNIALTSTEAGARSLVVASTGPEEGKTLVASNIAIALAQSGRRVLLVDADLRRPRQHDVFGFPQAPGLSDALLGHSKMSEALNASAVPNLWVLTAGGRQTQPVELLGSARFRELLAAVNAHFDWIIIDTPPVMPVTDPVVAAHAATAVLFVIGSDMVSRLAAQRAISQLRLSKANMIGAVLNRVDLKHHPLYYSSDYRKRYSSYYKAAS